MWEFYLAASEMAFREQAMMVFQLQLTKRQGVVPMTRDYIMRERSAPARARRQPPAAAAPRRRIDFRTPNQQSGSVKSSRYDAIPWPGDSGERSQSSQPVYSAAVLMRASLRSRGVSG